MIWKQIPGWPDYEVSEFGGIRRPIKHRYGFVGERKPYLTSAGYPYIVLRRPGERKAIAISRIVASTFHGEPPTPDHEAAHLDGNPLNNHFSNIAWATPSENQMHRVLHGTSNRGQRQHMNRLSPEQVIQIRRLTAQGFGKTAIARYFGVSPGAIQGIQEGRSWYWLKDGAAQ